MLLKIDLDFTKTEARFKGRKAAKTKNIFKGMWVEHLKELCFTHMFGRRNESPDDKINHVVKFEKIIFKKSNS